MFSKITPIGLNKAIRKRLEAAGITKRLTLYSFKRNGVTHMRLNGYSDNAIQHRARWTSTDQLQTYDLGNQDDAFRMELEQKGLLKGQKNGGLVESIPTQTTTKLDMPLVNEAPAPKFCTNCGGGLVVGARFCGGCGSPSCSGASHLRKNALCPALVTRGHEYFGT
jgi:hypothetical protein